MVTDITVSTINESFEIYSAAYTIQTHSINSNNLNVTVSKAQAHSLAQNG